MIEVTTVLTSEEGGTGRGWGNRWGAGNVLHPDLGGGYTGLYTWKIPQTVH